MLLKNHYVQRVADMKDENSRLIDNCANLAQSYIKRDKKLSEAKNELFNVYCVICSLLVLFIISCKLI